MLKNGRNKDTHLSWDSCSCHNSKNDRRAVKKSLKRKEDKAWRAYVELYEKTTDWTSANRGEVWELKHDGEFGLWVCLDPTGNAMDWQSYDGKWCLLEDEDLEAISQGTFTGVVLDLN